MINLDVLQNYDWVEVFGFASDGADAYNSGIPSSILSEIKCDEEPFTTDAVEEIYGLYEGENDEEDWLIAGRLKDGRHFMIEAVWD